MNYKFKDITKVILNTFAPSLYSLILQKRYFTVNDLRIHSRESYSSDGTFPTMYNAPHSKYKKWLESIKFDESGVPLWYDKGKFWYNPVNLIQFGLSEYGYYKTTMNIEHLNRAKNIANWLIDNQDIESGKWHYQFDHYYKPVNEILKAPWSSAMAQGEAIAFLSRMYTLKPDKVEYIEVCKNAIKPLYKTVKDGGLRDEVFGFPIFEEYPTHCPSHVLNGFMFCLIGLYDLSELCYVEEAKVLFYEGMNTLINILPLYDSEHTSYYDLSHITNSPKSSKLAGKYDPIHVSLLQVLSIIHPNKVLQFYLKKWGSNICNIKKVNI